MTVQHTIATALSGGPRRAAREWDVVGTAADGTALDFTSTRPDRWEAEDLAAEVNDAGGDARVVRAPSRRLGDRR